MSATEPGVRTHLVTGAGGFIGSHLVGRLVARGERVRALDLALERIAPLSASPGLEMLRGDVCDLDLQTRALDGVDTVFHLAAAHLGVRHGIDEFRRINVAGTRTLTRSALAAGVRRFVHCSSVGVYGTVADPPADEDAPCRPEIPYERTKLEGELEVRSAVELGLDAAILRPVWVYGPGCQRTEKLIRSIGKGRFLVAGRGVGLRHCVSIWDMVDAFLLARDARLEPGTVVVVGDRRPVTVRELVDTIAKLLGARPPRSLPMPLFVLAATGAEALFLPLRREPPMSRRTLKFFTGNTAFDVRRAEQTLGFVARDDLIDGLRRTIEWSRSHSPAEWLRMERGD
jgi:dihydroflavonol-4-reductase